MPNPSLHLADLVFGDSQSSEPQSGLVSKADFLATYGDDARQRYYEFRAFEIENSSNYYTNVARKLDINIGKAQMWENGSIPNPVEGVRYISDLGWFADEWTDTTRAAAKLVIGLHVTGAMTNSFAPYWRMDALEEMYRAAFDDAGVEIEVDDGEAHPTERGGPIGRALWVAGAPQGNDANRSRLPLWLAHAPDDLVKDCARILVLTRSHQNRPETDMRMMNLRREESWYRDVSALLELATGHSTPPWDGGGITIPADAVRALGLA